MGPRTKSFRHDRLDGQRLWIHRHGAGLQRQRQRSSGSPSKSAQVTAPFSTADHRALPVAAGTTVFIVVAGFDTWFDNHNGFQLDVRGDLGRRRRSALRDGRRRKIRSIPTCVDGFKPPGLRPAAAMVERRRRNSGHDVHRERQRRRFPLRRLDRDGLRRRNDVYQRDPDGREPWVLRNRGCDGWRAAMPTMVQEVCGGGQHCTLNNLVMATAGAMCRADGTMLGQCSPTMPYCGTGLACTNPTPTTENPGFCLTASAVGGAV